MGGTDDKVQNSLAINKSQDFWGCTVLKWHLHLKMKIYLIFNLPHRQMHAHVLVLKPQLFPAPHFSQEELFHSPSASPLQWSSAPSPICCSPLPQMLFCFSQSSFAYQFLPLLPRHKFPCNPASGREWAMGWFPIWGTMPTEGWEPGEISLKGHVYPNTLKWEIWQTNLQCL